MSIRLKRKGMTLVEIILAMAILAIIVISMTPVLVSAFRQIVLNGNRNAASKVIIGNIDEMIAGSSMPAVQGEKLIALPSGEVARVNKFAQDGSDPLGTIHYDFYTPLSGLQNIKANVDGWRSTSKYGTIELRDVSLTLSGKLKYTLFNQSTSAIIKDEYGNNQIDIPLSWTESTYFKKFYIGDNSLNYSLVISNSTDINDKIVINIGKAPIIEKRYVSASSGPFQIWRINELGVRELIVQDMAPASSGDHEGQYNYAYIYEGMTSWNALAQSSTVYFSMNGEFYVHIVNSNSISTIGYKDTNSLPAYITN